jgi:hypothetical protein
MATAATKDTSTPPPPPPIRPLERGRVDQLGHKVREDTFITFRNAAEIDAFAENPVPFLLHNGEAISTLSIGSKIRAMDAQMTKYAEFLVTLVRGNSGSGLVQLDVVELLNVECRPALPLAEGSGWEVKFMNPAMGWTVLRNGHVVQQNCVNEAAARSRLNQELANAAVRR